MRKSAGVILILIVGMGIEGWILWRQKKGRGGVSSNDVPMHKKDVFDRLMRLPIATWYYKRGTSGRHIGPMAQDWHTSFPELGGGVTTTIYVVDAIGVLIASLKEVGSRLEQQQNRINQLHDTISVHLPLADEQAHSALCSTKTPPVPLISFMCQGMRNHEKRKRLL